MSKLKAEVIKYSKKLNITNLSALRSGNISARAKENGVEGFYITPSGRKYSSLKIKDIVLRLSTVIGKGCHSTFLSRLSEEIFKKNKIEIYNPNSKYNSCIHISNLNKIILKLLNFNQKKDFDVVNIHSSNPMKIIDIFKLFHRKTNNKKIKYFLKRSKKKSYLLKSKSLKSYKISVTSTKSNLQKFISEIY